jgi:hypothetical protein
VKAAQRVIAKSKFWSGSGVAVGSDLIQPARYFYRPIAVNGLL